MRINLLNVCLSCSLKVLNRSNLLLILSKKPFLEEENLNSSKNFESFKNFQSLVALEEWCFSIIVFFLFFQLVIKAQPLQIGHLNLVITQLEEKIQHSTHGTISHHKGNFFLIPRRRLFLLETNVCKVHKLSNVANHHKRLYKHLNQMQLNNKTRCN